MRSSVFERLGYTGECLDCGGELKCWGVQALVGGSLRWDTGSMCTACGSTAAVCGEDLPAELRARLLSDHGPARLLVRPPAGNAAVMRVLRAALGVDLVRVKPLLGKVLTGEYSGTLPEVELLARALRAAGIDAVAVRP